VLAVDMVMVYPSGAARAAISMPITPPARHDYRTPRIGPRSFGEFLRDEGVRQWMRRTWRKRIDQPYGGLVDNRAVRARD